MARYYCSGFDQTNIFGHGLGDMLKSELNNAKSLVCIPGGYNTIKTKEKYIPLFKDNFKKIGIDFEKVTLITINTKKDKAQEYVKNASLIILMGGNPLEQKEICEKLGLMSELKKYKGPMIGISAGAMLMSKYIIITPCSLEYPDFCIEEGLNLDGISIYPHLNTNLKRCPNVIINDEEKYKKDDLIKVANKYGNFYLIQDYYIEDGLVDVSYIRSCNERIELHTENNGKIWVCSKDGVRNIK